MSSPFKAPPPGAREDAQDPTRYVQETPRERAEWADGVVLAKRALLYRLSVDGGLLAGIKRAPSTLLMDMLLIDALNRVADRMP